MIQNISTDVKQKNTLTNEYYNFNNTVSHPLEEEKFDKEEIKRQILSNIRSYLSYLLPNGTFHGDEFRVGNIHGKRGQSLRVALTGAKAGFWKDFATEEKGDTITIWARVHGKDTKIDFREIMSSISKWLGCDKKCPEEQYTSKKLGEIATYSWNYYDENGQVIVKVYRRDLPGGKKEYKPFDVKQSKFTAPEQSRPLYNSRRLEI